MSQFYKRFLTEEAARLSPGADRFIGLGAFGKHPGWDDHVEDLGLETETLTLAKRVLYIQGVGGQIDTGAWEKLDPANRLEGFNHVFVWQRSRQFLVGRMWSSKDGKGRARYPMVLCAQCIGVSLAWGLERVLGQLQELEQACKAASSAAEVRSLLASAQGRLRGALPGAEGETQFTPSLSESLKRFVNERVFGPDLQGWFRILYQLENQMSAFGPENFNPKGDFSALRAQQVRVPAGAASPDGALQNWRRFFSARIERSVPLLLLLSPGEGWVDAILGEPSTQEFFCLRAKPAVLPLVTEVPYELTETFKTRARALLADFQSGKPVVASAAEAASASGSGGWISITQRWFKGKGSKLFLGVGLGAAILAGAAAWWAYGPATRKAAPELPSAVASPTAVPAPKVASSPAVPGQPAPAMAGPVEAPKQSLTKAVAPATRAPESNPLAQPTAEAGRAPGATVEPSRPAQAPKAAVVSAEPPPQADTQETKVQASAASTRSALQSTNSTGVVAPPPPQPVAGLAEAAPKAVVATPVVAAVEKPRTSLPLALTNTIGMVLVWIAALPGCADGGYVSKYEVTQAQFQRVMDSNPSQSRNPQQPVESVTWEEAVEFCHRLTALEAGRNAAGPALGYALPSEAQWEYFLGDARFEDAVTSRTTLHDAPAPVGSLAPNRFGLYDVLGNVWEFCSDSGTSPVRILHGAAFNNRKLYGENATEWRPLERTSTRRLGLQERAPDAGFRCVALVQP
jgi:Sulfatase-modifying factor enzyme 1